MTRGESGVHVFSAITCDQRAEGSFPLWRKTVRDLRKHGHTVTICVARPQQDIVAELLQAGASIIIQDEAIRGTQRRLALSQVMHAWPESTYAFCYLEQYTFASSLQNAAQSVLNNDVDLVIPQRMSLSSYPYDTQVFDRCISLVMGDLVGITGLDLAFGPRIFNQRVAQQFLDYPGDWWDWLYYPVVASILDGYSVCSVPVDCPCPKELQSSSAEIDPGRLAQITKLLSLMPNPGMAT